MIYTGTHDTPTFVQWLFEQAAPAERDYAFDYLRLREDEGFGWGAVCGAWMSPCRLAIAPMQDLLGLGGDARGQHPGHSRPPELELAGTAGGPQPQCVRPPGPHHPHLPPIA